MDGGLTATVCTVATTLRCEVVTDGPHSRVDYAHGAWWRWLPIGAWVRSARVTARPVARPPTLLELAASVPRGERPAALARIGYPVETVWRQP